MFEFVGNLCGRWGGTAPVEAEICAVAFDARKYSLQNTYTSLIDTVKHGALLAHAAANGEDFSYNGKYSTLTNIQSTHKQ
jgi:hypothetical protein